MQIRYFTAFIFTMMLSGLFVGCDHRLQFDKDILVTAHYGEKYKEVIQIEDVKLLYTLVGTNLPDNSGLKIDVDGKSKLLSENIIIIDGTPKIRGDYDIRIYGKFRGGAMGGVTDFEKKYTLRID